MDTGGSFVVGKSGLIVKLTSKLHLVLRWMNGWSYATAPPYVFIEWCVIEHTNNFAT
jgi:hypothetical protein